MSEQQITLHAERYSHADEVRGEPVRLLIVAPSLDILGGQAVQAGRLLRHLEHEPGVKASFLPINPRLPGPFRLLQSIKYVRTVVTSLLYLMRLLIEIPRNDVIHVFSASYLSFIIAPTPAILIARLWRKKIVLNYRSGEAEDHLRRWRRTALPTLRLADAIAAPSRYLVDVFARFGLHACAIFNVVDTSKFRFRRRQPLRPVFLSNRNLEPMYNVACILRAFAIVQQRHPEASLMIAGDGSQRAELERLAAELRLQNTTFLGRISPHKMSELYDSADIYLNSSNIDNMPGSIIEAFASGVPVVTTDAGGIPYIVQHEVTGLMVPSGDFDALASCALRLLEDNALAATITNNARLECEKYNWDAVRAHWLQLYYRLAGERDSRQSVQRREQSAVRVLIVAPSLDILGGQAVQADSLLNRMTEEPGVHVKLLPINPRLPGPLRRLQSVKYVRTILTSIEYLASLVVEVPRFDVIQVLSASYLSFLLAPLPGVLIGRMFGKKVILNYHSGEADDHLRRWPRTTIPVLRLADAIVVPSDYLVGVFKQFGFRPQSIFNIVDTARFAYRSRNPLRPVFLSNRNLEPLYNVGCILRAFKLIQRDYPNAKLTIAGDGSQRVHLEKLARELELRGTRFVGRVPFDKIDKLYAEADIYLNSSEIDNMPVSIIESFASGLPVVTTNAGGIPYMVTHEQTGLVVDRGDYAGLAACAARLLEDPALALRLATNARAECENYRWEAVRDQWVELYSELTGKPLRRQQPERAAAA